MQQLINSNLTDHFEALSINAIEKYKPAAETYLWAAKKLAVKPQDDYDCGTVDLAGRKCWFSYWIYSPRSIYLFCQACLIMKQRTYTKWF
jgi:hypothetical protein